MRSVKDVVRTQRVPPHIGFATVVTCTLPVDHAAGVHQT